MKLIEMNVSGKDVRFMCDSRNTRNGFAHDATIFINGICYGTSHSYYLNRTWESYAYQTVCIERCDELLSTEVGSLKAIFKMENGISRLTGKWKAAFDRATDSDEFIILLREVRRRLRDEQF